MQVVLLCRGSFYTCNEDLLEKPSGNYSCGKVYDEAKKIHHNNTGIQFLIFSKCSSLTIIKYFCCTYEEAYS